MKRTLLIGFLVAASGLLACAGDTNADIQADGGAGPGTPSTPADGGVDAGTHGTPTDGGSGGPPPPVATSGDLPCDVQAVLANCITCHGTNLTGGAPVRLVTYQDLIAPSPVDPTELEIDRAIARMGDAQRPMPPTGPAPASDIAVLVAWRNAGMPPSTCNPATDGGTPGGGTDAGTPITEVCTSGTFWSSGNNGSSKMNPGLACIECHSQRGAPEFAAAGTLYPTIREPDLCNGASSSTYGGASVEIIDAQGKTYSTTPNSAGNFYINAGSANLVMPIRARVSYQGKTREMLTAQNSADCNSCHTEQGTNGAPGRVALP